MTSNRTFQIFLGLYISIFFLYLFGPLIIMSVTAFNSAEFPSITPWECFSFRWFNEGKIAYDGQRLAGLAADRDLHWFDYEPIYRAWSCNFVGSNWNVCCNSSNSGAQ